MGEEMLFLGHGFPGLKTARIDLDGCKIELPDLDDVFFEEVSVLFALPLPSGSGHVSHMTCHVESCHILL